MIMEERDINGYINNYLKQPFLEYNVEYRRRAVIESLNRFKHRNVLEIGCGFWPLFSYIPDSEYDEWIVVEPGEIFYNNAIKLSEHNKKISVINDYFESSDCLMSGTTFDIIICSSLLHEVTNEKVFLHKLYDVCDVDTVVHINVPNANSFHRLLAKESGIISDVQEMSKTNKKLEQRVVYSYQTLKEELKDNGFEEINHGSFFIKPFTHSQMQKMLDDNIIDKNVIEGLYKLCNCFPEYGSELYMNVRKVSS